MTIIDIIVTGIGQTVGWELVTATMLLFSFLLLAINKGLGTTALFSTLMLGVYLLSSNAINTRYLLDQPILMLFVIMFGLFLGWLFYMIVIRD